MAESNPTESARNDAKGGNAPVMGQMARGAAWMIGFRAAERGLGFISVLILARLLIPEDFGLVAIAMSVVALIELVGAFGFDVALIQHRDPKSEHFNTVFTMNALIGLAGGLLLAALAHVTANYFADERLINIMYVLAVAWAVQGFENVGPVMFRRNMDFRREFIFLTSKRLLTFIATLVAAFALRSYWALVIGIVTGRVAMLILSFVMHPYRPRFSLAAVRELLSYSLWLLLGNFVHFFILRLSTFVVGRTESPGAVGFYTVAYEIGTLPTSELLAPINRAIIPGFAKIAHNSEELRARFLDVVGLTTAFAVPAAFGIAAIAEPLVTTLLTSKWADAVPLMQVLAFLGAAAAIISAAFPAFYALGKPKYGTFINSFRLAIVIPAMIAGASYFGVMGVAWADLGAALIALPFSIAIACRVLQVRIADLLGHIWRPIVAAIAMYYGVSVIIVALEVNYPTVNSLGVLLMAAVSGMLMYFILMLSLWIACGRPPGGEASLFEFVRRRFRVNI